MIFYSNYVPWFADFLNQLSYSHRMSSLQLPASMLDIIRYLLRHDDSDLPLVAGSPRTAQILSVNSMSNELVVVVLDAQADPLSQTRMSNIRHTCRLEVVDLEISQ